MSKFKLLLVAIVFMLLGCSRGFAPGTKHYVNYRKGLSDEFRSLSTEKLLKELDSVKGWDNYRCDPLGRYSKLRMKYYSITEILRERKEDKEVYQAFMKMTDKYESLSVARDSIRFLESYFELEKQEFSVQEDFVQLYADGKTHPGARNEILNVFLERKIKSPEILWYIRDVRDELGEKAHLEEVYIGFLNAG